jgi:hypothetical protein
MARTTLTVTAITDAGVALPAATNGTVDGHMFTNDGNTVLEIKNNGAATRVVTIQLGGAYKGRNFEDQTVSLTTGQTKHVGVFDTSVYNITTGADKAKVYVDFPSGFESEIAVRAFKV